MPTHNWVRLVCEMFPYDYHIPSQRAGLSPGIVKTVNIWEKWHQVITDCPTSLLITFIKVPQSQPTAIKQRCMNKHAATMVESLRYLNVWKPIKRIREYIFAYFNSFYIGLILLLLLLLSYRCQGVQQQSVQLWCTRIWGRWQVSNISLALSSELENASTQTCFTSLLFFCVWLVCSHVIVH